MRSCKDRLEQPCVQNSWSSWETSPWYLLERHRAGHKQSRMFLECLDDNFLLQMTEEPVRRGAVLDLGCDQWCRVSLEPCSQGCSPGVSADSSLVHLIHQCPGWRHRAQPWEVCWGGMSSSRLPCSRMTQSSWGGSHGGAEKMMRGLEHLLREKAERGGVI